MTGAEARAGMRVVLARVVDEGTTVGLCISAQDAGGGDWITLVSMRTGRDRLTVGRTYRLKMVELGVTNGEGGCIGSPGAEEEVVVRWTRAGFADVDDKR
jgi:hypothetical protein